MLRDVDRKLLILAYAYLAWKFLTLASLAAAGAVALTLQYRLIGVGLIPIAGIFGILGVMTLQAVRDTIHAPHF